MESREHRKMQGVWAEMDCEKEVGCTIQRGVRFMIRLQAKFDLAAPETDSEAESYEDMKCV